MDVFIVSGLIFAIVVLCGVIAKFILVLLSHLKNKEVEEDENFNEYLFTDFYTKN